MRSLLLSKLLILLFQFSPVSSLTAQTRTTADTMWIHGMALLDSQNYVGAINIFQIFDSLLVSEGYTSDSIRIATLHKLNKCHFELYENEQAITYATEAIGYQQLTTDVPDHLWFLLYSSRASSRASIKQFVQSLADLDTAATFLSTVEYPTEDHSELNSNYGFYYHKKGDDRKALDFYYKALATDTLIYGINHNYTALTYNNIGSSLESLGFIQQAIDNFERSLQIRIELYGHDGTKTSKTYLNLANSYSAIGRHEKALEYRLQVLRTRKSTFDEREPNSNFAISHLNVSGSYFKNAEYKKAEFHLHECLNILESIPGFNPHIYTAIAYLQLSKALMQQGKTIQAFEAVEKSLTIHESLSRKSPLYFASSLATKANYHLDRSELTYARLGFQSALSTMLEAGNAKHYLLSDIYYQLGHISESEQKFNAAKDLYLKGLAVLYSKELVIFEDADLKYFNKLPHLPKLLGSYAAMCRQIYLQEEDRETLLSGIRALQFGTKVIEEITDDIGVLQDKIKMNEPLRYIYEELIQSLSLLPEVNTIDKMLIIDKANSTVQRQIEKRLSNNKNEAFQKYAQLRAYKKRLLLKTTKAEDQSVLQKEVFDLSSKLDSIIGFKEIIPDDQVHSLKEIQEQLPDSVSVVNYYITGKRLNSFLLTNDSIYHFERDAAELESKVLKMLEYLDGSTSCTAKEFGTLSLALYDLLRAPLDLIISKSNEVIIIPDGVLNFLPFEILTRTQTAEHSFGSIPYLLHSLDISYAYSLDDIDMSKIEIGNSYIGVSPSFTGALQLPNNKKEVSLTSKYFSDVVILDGIAGNKDNFIQAVSESSIYHLATHAIADDEQYEESVIYFSRVAEEETSNSISFSEISTLSMEGSMAILSACQTGKGKVYSGQGIMSLAKAFKLAGCKNLITTLWDLNDKVSSTLLPTFAESLLHGQSSPSALATSKISYLKSDLADGLKHPKYWANYICIGHTFIIDKSQLSWKSLWPIGVLLIIILLVWIRKLN